MSERGGGGGGNGRECITSPPWHVRVALPLAVSFLSPLLSPLPPPPARTKESIARGARVRRPARVYTPAAAAAAISRPAELGARVTRAGTAFRCCSGSDGFSWLFYSAEWGECLGWFLLGEGWIECCLYFLFLRGGNAQGSS